MTTMVSNVLAFVLRRLRHDRRGGPALEFALMAPVFLGTLLVAFEILYAIVTDRGLGIDDIVDEDRAGQSSLFETRQRPFRPIRIVGHEIEQDIRVDQDHVSDRRASSP